MPQEIDTIYNQTPNGCLGKQLKAEPMQSQERIETLDMIRGFALLGILIVNMALYNSPALYFEILGKSEWVGVWDTITSSFINIFIQGKFYSIFSFLFGLGFAIFFERAKGKTTKPKPLFYRRLFILLLIGLIHALFIWFGDILVTYALLGFLLPPFFNQKSKTILKWAFSLFAIFILFMVLAMGLLGFAKRVLPEETFSEMVVQPLLADIEKGIESSYHSYGQGTFAEITAQRFSDFSFAFSQIFTLIFTLFPLFLLGLYAGKRALFQNLGANNVFIKKTWIWSLVVGLSMSIVKFTFKYLMGTDILSFNTAIYTSVGIFADTGLSIFYITSILLLYQNRKWKLRLKPLTYTGRMALSNYLFQSVICTTIFYSYGLGLYGKVGVALGCVFSITIFTMQVLISKYWLKHYRFGPVEWLWRSLTYGKLLQIKHPESNTLNSNENSGC